jgi:hypothetical protein
LNSYNWHSGCPNYQITAFVFFLFRSAGEWEVWLEGDSTWLIHYKKNHTYSHQSVLLKSFKFCAPVYSFDSGYSLVGLVEGGRRYTRGSDITIFFPSIAFNFFYYQKMNLLYGFIISKILVYIFNFFLTNPWNSIEKGGHTNCLIFLAFFTTYFDEHFFWKEIFQW